MALIPQAGFPRKKTVPDTKQCPYKIGDTVTCKLSCVQPGYIKKGRVAYVHPKNRWYMVEFKAQPKMWKTDNPEYFRECFNY